MCIIKLLIFLIYRRFNQHVSNFHSKFPPIMPAKDEIQLNALTFRKLPRFQLFFGATKSRTRNLLMDNKERHYDKLGQSEKFCPILPIAFDVLMGEYRYMSGKFGEKGSPGIFEKRRPVFRAYKRSFKT